MRRTLAKGENDLIWEIMADLANRQLGSDQVVAIHLDRREYTASVSNLCFVQEICNSCSLGGKFDS